MTTSLKSTPRPTVSHSRLKDLNAALQTANADAAAAKAAAAAAADDAAKAMEAAKAAAAEAKAEALKEVIAQTEAIRSRSTPTLPSPTKTQRL